MTHQVVITGVGIISSIGVGNEAHIQALTAASPKPVYDAERHAPIIVHPAPEIDFALQIPKREQRQMELWQKLGVYAAGLALDHAGLKDSELCRTMDMVVAAGGGERDVAVDAAIIARVAAGEDRGTAINAVLTNDLRPTLFLAQLSNLLAGNISIVHKVTGSSRTFMGEESAGVSALKTSVARIRHGQSTHALVGGSTNGEDADMLLGYEFDGQLARNGWSPVLQRRGKDGVITGSGAVFLVLESREHAAARGATILAEIGDVTESRTKRAKADTSDRIAQTFSSALKGKSADLVLSGASGLGHAAELELEALAKSCTAPVRAPTSLMGTIEEPQLILGAALAALIVAHDVVISPLTEDEVKLATPAKAVLAEVVGARRGEGAVLVSKA
jgi:3-oxoacyl-[acyl-carrier-protein] synthase II